MRLKDKLNVKAKKQGYRARSVYKLIELNKRFKLIKNGDEVLDIGAAPGSWSQFVSEVVGETGKVVGVDVLKINKIKNIEFIQADLMQDNLFDLINGEFDVVISDIAPETMGDRKLQQEISFELSHRSLEIALKVLKKNGNFLVKVFQSNFVNKLVKEVKKKFRVVKVYTPIASKKHSKEVYIIGKNRKIY